MSLSVFISKPLKFNIQYFSQCIEENINFLLGRKDVSLELYFQDMDGNPVHIIEPDRLYGFLEKNIVGYGGYFLYSLDEYWNYHSDHEVYEFSINNIQSDQDDFLFLIQLSMLISVAKIAGEEYLMDTYGILPCVKNDKVKVNELLDLKVDSEGKEISQSLACFYDRLNKMY
ncbi:hypothetical protein ID856_18660 [Xenorhabdus sp. 18]|uniref:hypothetical protein n=1 Tax=Xenorhabdus doucetiae TaxID=351671 RepID=UPI0019A93170|nr:hypothetical protein [Xenorhabdus sp. 18]MBD2798489.1 hypothetical protein [Xenorhabdus sp. 18]